MDQSDLPEDNWPNPEREDLPSIKLLDKQIPYTPSLLHEEFPNANRIFVLDFKLTFQPTDNPNDIYSDNETFLGTKTIVNDQEIYNIDHHYVGKSIPKFISTAHQVVYFKKQFNTFATTEDLILINHPDTDGAISSIILSQEVLDITIENRLLESVVAADHTGQIDTIVDLVDAYYNDNDIEKTISVIREFIESNFDINKLDNETKERYQKILEKREIAKNLVIENKFENAGNGVYWIELEKYIQTTMFAPFFEKYLPDAKVIVIAVKSNEFSDKWAMSIRMVNEGTKILSFQTLTKELNLSLYGFAGRDLGGSNSRNLKNSLIIEPQKLATMLSKHLETNI